MVWNVLPGRVVEVGVASQGTSMSIWDVSRSESEMTKRSSKLQPVKLRRRTDVGVTGHCGTDGLKCICFDTRSITGEDDK